MKAQPDYSIYLVTDDGCLQGRTLIDCVREALEGGVTLVQYRAKTASSAEMYAEALQLKALCDSFNVPLIINDRLDIAMAVGAAGVHLGQDDLPCAAARKILGEDYLIGVSAHNPAEAKAALQSGADYLGCGAVFGTATKADVKKLGTDGLAAICKAKGLPVIGIGGDLFEIRPQTAYTAADLDWNNAKSRSSVEMNDPKSRPAMAEPPRLAGYDTVFVGFPIWWYQAPRIIQTFLESADFSG